MKKITEITTKREFVSKLRTYYRKARRKGYQRNEISFLGLMECTGSATREFEYQSDKYFSLGIRAYDWQYGNSLLSALIDKWESEIEAEKRKKQPTQPTETSQISTQTAETVNVSAEEEKAAERAENNESAKLLTVIKRHEWGATPILFAYDPDKHIASATFKSISGDISVVNAKCDNDGYCHVYDSCITIEELAWENMHAHNFIEPPQSPGTPQAAECIADTPKPRETARKRPNRAIGSAQHHQCSALGANGYAVLNYASATLTAMSVPRECSTADYW